MWSSISDQLLLPAEPPKALSAGQVCRPVNTSAVWCLNSHSRFPTSSSQRPHFRPLSMYRLSQQQHGVLPNKLLPISTFSPSERKAADSPTAEPVPAGLWIVFQPSSCTAMSSQAQGKWEVKPREHLDRWEQLSGRCGVLKTETDSKGLALYNPPAAKFTPYINIFPPHTNPDDPPRFENHHIYSVWRWKYCETKTF